MVRADVIVSSRADAVAFTPRAGRRARRERARSPGASSRTGRRRRDATLAFPATTPPRRPRAPLERATSLFPSPQPPTADRSKR